MDVKPKGILRRLVALAVHELERRSRPPGSASSLPPEGVEPALEAPPQAAAPPSVAEATRTDDEDTTIKLEVVWAAPDEARIRWSLREEDLEPARALTHADAQLALRTVAFSADRSGVLREASDVAVSSLRGELLLHRARPERLLVAVGLLYEAEFCSIAHLEVR